MVFGLWTTGHGFHTAIPAQLKVCNRRLDGRPGSPVDGCTILNWRSEIPCTSKRHANNCQIRQRRQNLDHEDQHSLSSPSALLLLQVPAHLPKYRLCTMDRAELESNLQEYRAQLQQVPSAQALLISKEL